MQVSASQLARGHGAFNIVMGLWPLIHIRSFEAVSGPKLDRWLARTVGGLMAGNGLVQFLAPGSRERLEQARVLGITTAGTLLAIDAYYGGAGRISRVYLLDAVTEAALIAGWVAAPIDE